MSALATETWGELGPAMRDLTEMQREFVRALVTEPPGYGMLTRAAPVTASRAGRRRYRSTPTI